MPQTISRPPDIFRATVIAPHLSVASFLYQLVGMAVDARV